MEAEPGHGRDDAEADAMSKAILAALSIILLSGVAWAYGYHEFGAYCAGVSSGVSLFGIWIAWTSRPSELRKLK